MKKNKKKSHLRKKIRLRSKNRDLQSFEVPEKPPKLFEKKVGDFSVKKPLSILDNLNRVLGLFRLFEYISENVDFEAIIDSFQQIF